MAEKVLPKLSDSPHDRATMAPRHSLHEELVPQEHCTERQRPEVLSLSQEMVSRIAVDQALAGCFEVVMV